MSSTFYKRVQQGAERPTTRCRRRQAYRDGDNLSILELNDNLGIVPVPLLSDVPLRIPNQSLVGRSAPSMTRNSSGASSAFNSSPSCCRIAATIDEPERA